MRERRFHFPDASDTEKQARLESLGRIGFVSDGGMWTRDGVLLRETAEGDDEIVYRFAPRRLAVGLCVSAMVTAVVSLSILSVRWLADASFGTPATEILASLSIVFWPWLGMAVYAWMVEGGFRREREFLDAIMGNGDPSESLCDVEALRPSAAPPTKR